MTRVFFSAVLAFALSRPTYAQTPARAIDRTLSEISHSFEQIAEQVGPSVVQIIARGPASDDQSGSVLIRDQRSSGSGVIVDADGYIVTNAHVVGVARKVQVLVPSGSESRAAFKSVIKPAGKLVVAQVIGVDRETDVAVLKIAEKGLRPLRFGDSEALRQGQLSFAFGSPFGLENSVTMGVISSPARQIRPDQPMIYIQTDASINPGNSGGPLVDVNATLIGLNTFIFSTSGANAGVGFAAPANIVRNVYEQIKRNGRVRRGQIGIQAQTVTPELARLLHLGHDSGVLVGDVAQGGPAEAAGIEVKDLLLTLNGKPLENARQFGVNVYQRAGETVTVELLRGTEKLTKQVAVLERPRDSEQMLSMVDEEKNLVAKLGVLALDLDARTTSLLPPLRRLSGIVVAGVVADRPGSADTLYPADVIYGVNDAKVGNVTELQQALSTMKRGESVAVQVERLGQLQFVVLDLQ